MSNCSRGMLGRLAALVLAVVLAWPPPGVATAASSLPEVPNRVLDQTRTLDAGQVAALERKLAAFEQRRGPQIAVVLVKTTAPDTIEQYAVALFEKNAFGRKGADDGVLLLVAKDDRNARIEVGYGLEGTIPDVHASRILDQYLVPAFRAGDFHGGIDRATDALMALVDTEANGGKKPSDLPKIDNLPTLEVYFHDVDQTVAYGDHRRLTDKLGAFEGRTGSRVNLVLLGNALYPLPVYAQAMLAQHPIGRPGLDDYVIVLATRGGDAVEIVVGEGLKPAIGAVERQRIVSEILVPKLSAGKPYEAFDAATDALFARVEGPGLLAFGADASGPAALAHLPKPPSRPFDLADLLLPLLMTSLLAAIVGSLVGGMLEFLPRWMRAPLGAAAAGYVVWVLMQDHAAAWSAAWATVVGALTAFYGRMEWFAGGGGGSGRSGGGGGGGGSRSSGGRSGGGGASRRW